MTDYSDLPGVEENAFPYFPPLYGKPDCLKCEKRKDCGSYGKYQRDRRDFTYTSGRCPRLPDRRGFVEQDERELYAQTFPLIHAESGGCEGEETLTLQLSIPGETRYRKVYRAYGYWWFRSKTESGEPVRRILTVEADGYLNSPKNILKEMRGKDYCIFRCEITNDYL